ncbi:MAG: hypothetical protein J6J42_05600 [Lachnospiraceae bacterium]|nr:hypothetical protein [Lachnospiraceae bacterium]
MKALLILLLLPVIYYLLYSNGYMITGSKSAKVFVGKNRGTNAFWTQFVDCSGELKRVARFRKSKEYKFCLNASIAGGTASIEILDREKQVLLSLTPEQPEGRLMVDVKQKYFMVYRFESASGAYELTWE